MTSSGELLVVKKTLPAQRLFLLLLALCCVLPLLGMLLGVSQGILVAMSALCLIVIVLHLVLRLA